MAECLEGDDGYETNRNQHSEDAQQPLYNAGYRDGADEVQNAALQARFDEGYAVGYQQGYRVGRLLGGVSALLPLAKSTRALAPVISPSSSPTSPRRGDPHITLTPAQRSEATSLVEQLKKAAAAHSEPPPGIEERVDRDRSMFPRGELLFRTQGPSNAEGAPKIRAVEVHPVKSWVAVADESDTVAVYDFERKELLNKYTAQGLREQQLEYEKVASTMRSVLGLGSAASSDLDASVGPIRSDAQGPGDRALRTGLLGGVHGKAGSVEALAFFDAEAVSWVLRQPSMVPTSTFRPPQWLAILTDQRLILVDHYTEECRHLTSQELNKASATSVTPIGYTTLAIGCSDGQLRLWDTRSWSLSATLQAHSKDVIRVVVVHPTDYSSASIRLVTLGQEGSLLLWRSNEWGDPSGRAVPDPPEQVPLIDGLRPIARLEGAVIVKGDTPPHFVYNDATDALAIMDATRKVTVWDLSSNSDGGSGWAAAPSTASSHTHTRVPSRPRRTSTMASNSTETTADLPTVQRSARYKLPLSAGKVTSITSAFMAQYPCKCAYMVVSKGHHVHVLDDADTAADDETVGPSTSRDSPKNEDGGAVARFSQLHPLEDLDMRPLVAQDRTLQQRLRLVTVAQHPTRAHTLVLTTSQSGVLVVVVNRHAHHGASFVKSWGPSYCLSFDCGQLLRTSLRIATRKHKAWGHDTGSLAVDAVLASDLVPVTSGPSVPQVPMTHTASSSIAGAPGSPRDATGARHNAARKRPDLLVSLSAKHVAVFWPSVAYYITVTLPVMESQQGSKDAPSTGEGMKRASDTPDPSLPPLTIPPQPVTASTHTPTSSSPSVGTHTPTASASITPTHSSVGAHRRDKFLRLKEGAGSAQEIDCGPAQALAWFGARHDLYAVIKPGGDVRVAEMTNKKRSTIFSRHRARPVSSMENAEALPHVYIPPTLEIREVPKDGEAGTQMSTPVPMGDVSQLPGNPQQVLGGHPDLLLVGWSPEGSAPQDQDPVSLRGCMWYHFYRVLMGGDGKANVTRHGHPLPPVCVLAWDNPSASTEGGKASSNEEQRCAMSTLDHGVLIYRVLPDMALLASVSILTHHVEPAMSLLWIHGTLLWADQTQLHVVLPAGAQAVDSIPLATTTAQVPMSRSALKAVLSKPLGDTTEEVVLGWRDPDVHSEGKAMSWMYDTVVPWPQRMPKGQVQMLGLHEGGLAVRTPSNHLHVISLDHPTVRMGMLLAVGHVKRAIYWSAAVEPHLHDDVALQLFDPRGPRAVEEALKGLAGLSMGVAIDLCIRHGLPAPLEGFLSSARDLVGFFDQVDSDTASDPCGLPYIARSSSHTPSATHTNTHDNSHTNTPVCGVGGSAMRRVAVFLAGKDRPQSVHDLLEACRRRRRFDDAMFIVRLLKDPQLTIDVAREAGRWDEVAMLQRSRGESTRETVEAWNALLEAQRPPALFGAVKLDAMTV